MWRWVWDLNFKKTSKFSLSQPTYRLPSHTFQQSHFGNFLWTLVIKLTKSCYLFNVTIRRLNDDSTRNRQRITFSNQLVRELDGTLVIVFIRSILLIHFQTSKYFCFCPEES